MRRTILYFFIFSLSIFSSVVKAADNFELILNSMNHCYDVENKLGVELAQCILAKLNANENPDGNKVTIVDDNPNKAIPSQFTLTITNKYGQEFVCKGIAKETIDLHECSGRRVAPER